MACILCVDDDSSILAATTIALSRVGHDVLTASSEQEALAAVEEHRPDLIILDVMMPEKTEGFHVVWKLRASSDEAIANTPIIMASAIHDHVDTNFAPNASMGDLDPAGFLPVQGWLDKPYATADLYALIDTVLEG